MDSSGKKSVGPVRVALVYSSRCVLETGSGGNFSYEQSIANLVGKIPSTSNLQFIHFVPARKSHTQKRTALGQSEIVEYRTSILDKLVALNPFSMIAIWVNGFHQVGLGAALRREQISLVYFLSPNWRALTVWGIPLIFTVWDLGHRDISAFPETSSYFEWGLRESLMRLTVPRAFHVFVDSSSTGTRLESIYGLRQDNWSSFGLLPTVETSGGSSAVVEGRYILYPASRWPHKNHLTLIDAFAILRREFADVRLVFTGSDKGNKGWVSRHAAGLGLGSSLIDLGEVGREDLVDLIRGATILAMPSLLGPTNLPPLEALRLGVPSVVSDVHDYGSPEDALLKKVDPLNVDAWVEAMRSILESPPPTKPFSPHATNAIELHEAVMARFLSLRRLWPGV